ncbi:hypothetical protein KUTeg_008353 [Tegillarca granosa]|uniref:Transposable element P transposase-like RNase H domain-containing protein n=1 Tax=Tegillarca granosa TaxID=220873 RepID=A0ABQ9F8Y1_TEGGR|nr:hypothetical protein KUTeg_008353 [Tegillarca granosa]
MAKTSLMNWLLINLEEGPIDDFVDLIEVKNKYSVELQLEVTSMSIGNCISKKFPKVNVKNGRCKGNWSKVTKRYYGLKWKNNLATETDSSIFACPIPEDFFVISKNTNSLNVGHFSNTMINGMKVLTETQLNHDNTWSLLVMGKIIDPSNLGIDSSFSINTVFDIIRQLSYCEGVHEIDESKLGKDIFKEHVSPASDENSEKINYRSKHCYRVLPFKNSNRASKTCVKCKKLEKPVKETTQATIDTLNYNCTDSIGECTDDQNLLLCKSDNNDMSIILNNVFPECSDKMKTFLLSQKMAMETNPNGRRWDRDIVHLCLTLWCRSPKGYNELRNSKFLMLPSAKLLQRFKNMVNQESGIKKDMLQWMANKNIPPEGYEGGLIIDEMSIQPDLQLKKKNGEIELIGFSEVVPESIAFGQMQSNKKERILATHVLQLVFLGSTGFRFPFAHFPSCTASGHELYLLLWKSVNMLSNFGFTIQFISTDGAQTNRDLFKLLLPDFKSSNPKTCSFRNIYSSGDVKIFFIMDFSHVIKKIRNNISKSGQESQCKRHLQLGGHFIEWRHFRQAYLWDISSHSFPVYHKLSQDHIFLTSEAKMRNHLAEEVLNTDMLHLMKLFQKSLGEAGSELNSTIELLENTSVLIKNFRDNRPITDSSDDRLRQNHDVLDFFIKWENDNLSDEKIKRKEFSMISHQTRQDIISSILGFEELCLYKLKKNSASVIPSRLNSDVVENIFCQQRTLHNGANTNPTYLSYCHSMNSIILGQTTVSRKSNTGGETAQPYSHQVTKKV